MEKKQLDFNKMYEDQLAANKEKVLGTSLYQTLEVHGIGHQKLDAVIKEIKKITDNRYWENFNFPRSGKILGILNSLAINGKHRLELFEVTGLNQMHIDIYNKVAGRLPYVDEDLNIMVDGRMMDAAATKELVIIVANKLGMLYDESDTYDITQERWNKLYDNAQQKCAATIEHNATSKDVILEVYAE